MARRLFRSSGDAHDALLEALAEERANALGRAGRKLEEAVDTHRLLVDVGVAPNDQVAEALRDVRDAAWALMVQRECAGFREPDLGWLVRHYRVPPEVLRRL